MRERSRSADRPSLDGVVTTAASARPKTRPNVLVIGPVAQTEATVSAILAELESPAHFWAPNAPPPARADGRAIVIRDIAMWSPTLQTAWLAWLTVQQERPSHMIATGGTAVFPLVRQGIFLADLYYRLNTTLVDLWTSTHDDGSATCVSGWRAMKFCSAQEARCAATIRSCSR